MQAKGMPPQPAKPLTGADICPNAWVDYYSNSTSSWLPTTIKDVHANGNVFIECRSTPIPSEHVEKVLQKRTIPSSDHLNWIRQGLANGKIRDEGVELFDRFARQHACEDRPCLPKACACEIAQECDALFGASGSIAIIEGECFNSGRDATIDKWMTCFKKIATSIDKGYSNAPLAKLEDPRTIYDFQPLRDLGRYTFGEVYLAAARDDKAHRIVKQISKERVKWQPAGRDHPEMRFLCAMDHPHIVKLREWFDYASDIYLVLDFYNGTELADEIGKRKFRSEPFQETFITQVMHQLLSAANHLHEHELVHLDIKGENLFLKTDRKVGPSKASSGEVPHIMITDLGFGFIYMPRLRNGDPSLQPGGTPGYMAPEVWDLDFTAKADIFSMGVVFFTMMSFRFPFVDMKSANVADMKEFWSTNPQPRWDLVGCCSDTAVQLCKAMVHQDSLVRPWALHCLLSPLFSEECQPTADGANERPDGQASLPRNHARTPERLVEDLMMMGFPRERAERASKRCSSVEAAVDWLAKDHTSI